MVGDLASILEELVKKEAKKLHLGIKKVFERDVVPFIVNEIMKSYDSLLVGRENAASVMDPTSPSKIRPIFKAYLERKASEAVVLTEQGISIKLVQLTELGVPGGPGNVSQELLQILSYYIEGMIGEVGFLNIELYEIFNPRGHRENRGGGRFGEGFLISRKAYEGQKALNPKRDKLPPFERIRHPLSGAGPNDIFSGPLRRIKREIPNFINRAVAELKG